MDANVSFTGNLGTDVEMKIGEGWREPDSGCPHPSRHEAGGGSMGRRPGCRCTSMADSLTIVTFPCVRGPGDGNRATSYPQLDR